MKKITFSIITATTLFLVSCGEEHSFLTNVVNADGAKVKFIHAAPDAPGVAIFVNDKKVSGVLTVAPATPSTITYGNVFPATDYAVLPAGTAKVKVTVPSLSDAVVMQGDAPLESGKYYSVFATGLAPNYAPVIVADNLPNATGNNIFIRLINLIPNSTDAEISVAGTKIISGVTAGKGGDKFVAYELPSYTGGTQTVALSIKTNGVVPANATLTLSGVNPSRAVTVVLRGLLSDKVGTASKYPAAVTSYLNR